MDNETESPTPPPAAAAAASPPPPVSDMEASNLRLTAVAKKLKALLSASQEELAQCKARGLELELAARSTSASSVLALLLSPGSGASEGSATEARVAARVPVAHPATGVPTLWCCLTDPSGGRPDWIIEDELLSRVPRFSQPVRQCEQHVAPGEAAALRSRCLEPVEDLRKYRVKAEALLRQRDAELSAARERAATAEALLGGSSLATAAAAAAAADAAASGLPSAHASQHPATPAAPGDLEGLQRRLAEAHSQAQRLLASRGEVLERERLAKEGEEEACREAALARKEALLWQNKWAEAVGAPLAVSLSGDLDGSTGLGVLAAGGGVGAGAAGAAGGGGRAGGGDTYDSYGNPIHAPGSSSSSAGASFTEAALAEAKISLQAELTKAQSEYTAYRRRAVSMIKEKDEQLKRLAEDLSAARGRLVEARSAASAAAGGGGGGGVAFSPSSSSSSSLPATAYPSSPLASGVVTAGSPPVEGSSGSGSGSGTPSQMHAGSAALPVTPNGTPDVSRWLYLRALLLKYLAEGDSSIKGSLEPAIFTVLGLAPTDIAHIARARASSGSGLGAGSGSGTAGEAVGSAVSGLVNGTVSGLGSLISLLSSGVGAGAGAGVGQAPMHQQQPQLGGVTLLRH